jgi:hypothetical protein
MPPPSPSDTKDPGPAAGPAPDAHLAVGPPPPPGPKADLTRPSVPGPVPAKSMPDSTVTAIAPASPTPVAESPPQPPAEDKHKPQGGAVPLPPIGIAPHVPEMPVPASPPTDALPGKRIKDKDAELPPPPPSGPEPRLVAQPVGPCPWTLHIHILKGRTQVEARIDKAVKFRVNCEHLDLQAPRGSIQAQGDVKVLGPDLEGKCERLTINWQDEQVSLDGCVHLKCRKEGQEVELKAEKLGLKLSQISPPETPAPPVSEEKTGKSDKPAAHKPESADTSGNDLLDHP